MKWPQQGSAEVVSPTGDALLLLFCAEHRRVSAILTLHLGHLETNMSSKKKSEKEKPAIQMGSPRRQVWVNISGPVMTREIYNMSN